MNSRKMYISFHATEIGILSKMNFFLSERILKKWSWVIGFILCCLVYLSLSCKQIMLNIQFLSCIIFKYIPASLPPLLIVPVPFLLFLLLLEYSWSFETHIKYRILFKYPIPFWPALVSTCWSTLNTYILCDIYPGQLCSIPFCWLIYLGSLIVFN